jgi:hypothetical protein
MAETEDDTADLKDTDVVWAYWEDTGPMVGAEVTLREALDSGRSYVSVARARTLGYLG